MRYINRKRLRGHANPIIADTRPDCWRKAIGNALLITVLTLLASFPLALATMTAITELKPLSTALETIMLAFLPFYPVSLACIAMLSFPFYANRKRYSRRHISFATLRRMKQLFKRHSFPSFIHHDVSGAKVFKCASDVLRSCRGDSLKPSAIECCSQEAFTIFIVGLLQHSVSFKIDRMETVRTLKTRLSRQFPFLAKSSWRLYFPPFRSRPLSLLDNLCKIGVQSLSTLHLRFNLVGGVAHGLDDDFLAGVLPEHLEKFKTESNCRRWDALSSTLRTPTTGSMNQHYDSGWNTSEYHIHTRSLN
ncbi:hypothetical protein SCHPADRAFT_707872 [Schizopora paradoxa]|uniref:Ubiquitin-like domain-containing protein n=1 Tax=Schizopora paradoxa TaxID=27342 RepID=A0A0H2R286_9AGAM|nr:hypothetical protein SCHPADRAFT_707872 [Schizopora paradoxa]